jgi:hypothetical protein
MSINLFLAGFWAVLGVWVFIWRPVDPRAPYRDVFGWLGILMAVYNLARWWSARLLKRRRTPMAHLHERDKDERTADAKEPGTPFDFEGPPTGSGGSGHG